MNKNIVIAAAVAAAAAAGYFIYTKLMGGNDQNLAQKKGKTHHLTNAFSRAKQRAVPQS